AMSAFMGDDRVSAVSPVRRIPVLMDDRVTLADSSVICQYLEDHYPTPALLPADIGQRARTRWLEGYADTRMGEGFIWRLFNPVTINPLLGGEPTDQEIWDARSRRRSRRCWAISRASCQRRDISSAMSRSPTSPSPFSLTPPSRALRSTARAGQRRRRSS